MIATHAVLEHPHTKVDELAAATALAQLLIQRGEIEKAREVLAPIRQEPSAVLPRRNARPARAEATVRARPGDPPTLLPSSAWRFKGAGEIGIERPPGFDAGAIYQFRYEARDPRPMGLGMAAVRCRHLPEDRPG
ncbi:hypothetical protein QTI66_37520 [Variovorax sp. J22R133]|uniref:hypothetical protein n=1 Tax=Variovorax brevis TaxID=3053503 RepID=UPI002575449E|nr:hypothetical protein [Variovorax sp. J22R133]MDM0117798.1 hypothetical protein [Variovorax sp. J22R133]